MKGTGEVPPGVRRAVARATCLLPRRVRGEVEAELLANLWQTRLDAEVSGLGTAAAWEVSVGTLGPLWRLALGLGWVHARARLSRWVLVGAALGGAAYAVQVQTHTPPSPVQEARP